ncbi:MAG: class I SAM-dependent methyltransferase [Gemmatimonadetes bacterium]|nr:class I SAM-dependent methyltransferase [Gemmatimonadota bacterium]
MSTRGTSDIERTLHPLVFELPDRRSPEAFAWVGHIPFAFWLVNALRPRRIVELGTHWGHSYFAFCQAIASLGLDAEAFAIDSWVGDEHSGFYGEEVFSEVESWNSSHYGDFSSLQRMRFDEATDQFSAGTIDLLHIDGMHTYDAVRADCALRDGAAAGRQPLAVRLHVDVPQGDAGFGRRRSEAEALGYLRPRRGAGLGAGEGVATAAEEHEGRRRPQDGHSGTHAPAHSRSPSPNVTAPSAATFHARWWFWW